MSLPFQENQLDKSSQMLKYHIDWFIFEFPKIDLFANRSIKLFVQLQPPEDHPRWNSDRHSQVADYKLRLPQESRALKWVTTIRTRRLGQPWASPQKSKFRCFPYPMTDPCLAYLRIHLPSKSTIHVGRYTRHGSYGYGNVARVSCWFTLETSCGKSYRND